MSLFRGFVFSIFSFFFMPLYGCTVEPLYHQTQGLSIQTDSDFREEGHLSGEPSDIVKKFSKIFVEEPSDRFGQTVRNRLLFLMYGRGGKPSAPIYKLSLQTSAITQTFGQPFDQYFNHPSGLKEFEEWSKNPGNFFSKTPKSLGTFGSVLGVGSYILRDIKSGHAVKNKSGLIVQGKGSVRASFNQPYQLYAGEEAERNAERRVAEELAEKIFLLLSIDLKALDLKAF
ncbi:hypothetical protein [Bartonella sp. B41]